MVNYKLQYQFSGATDTVKNTESLHIIESTSTTISIRPSTAITLEVYSGVESYNIYDYIPTTVPQGTTKDNIEHFQLEGQDILTPNKNYIKHFHNTHPYIFIRLINNVATPNGFFTLSVQHSINKNFDSVSVRDSTLKNNTLVSLIRPTTDFYIDAVDGNLTGFETIEIHAKGSLSTTESLLMNSDTITDIFIDPLRVDDTNIIKSDVATDTATGIGARTVLVNGLDDNRDPKQFSLTLNGTSNVSINDSCIFVKSLQLTEVGSMLFNVGNIRIYNTSVANNKLMCSIESGESISHSPMYEVASGFNAYITKLSLSGNCVDEGYIKIAKYSYTLTNPILSVIEKINVSPNMNLEKRVNITLLDSERLIILKKSYGIITGTNDIVVSLFGIQKKVNLDIQSTI